MPIVPNITPSITLNSEQTFYLLLASIAMEELSLSHLLNAEAEKIQFALGTLPGHPNAASFDEIQAINKDVRLTLHDVILKDILVQLRMDTILENFSPLSGSPS